MAMKSKPSDVYWLMSGVTLESRLKPLAESQAGSALGTLACSVTVRYGPTVPSCVTVTGGAAPQTPEGSQWEPEMQSLSAVHASPVAMRVAEDPQPPPLQPDCDADGAPHVYGGLRTCAVVDA